MQGGGERTSEDVLSRTDDPAEQPTAAERQTETGEPAAEPRPGEAPPAEAASTAPDAEDGVERTSEGVLSRTDDPAEQLTAAEPQTETGEPAPAEAAPAAPDAGGGVERTSEGVLSRTDDPAEQPTAAERQTETGEPAPAETASAAPDAGGGVERTSEDVLSRTEDPAEQPTAAEPQAETGEPAAEPRPGEAAPAEAASAAPKAAEASAAHAPPPLPAPELPSRPAAAEAAQEKPPPEAKASPAEIPAQTAPAEASGETAAAATAAESLGLAGIPGPPMPGLPDISTGAGEENDDEAIGFEEPVERFPSEAQEIRPGTRRTGRVVSIESNGVLVAFGAKIEGLVPLDELRDAEGNVTVQPDQEIDVVFERFGNLGEYAALSYHDAAEDEAWRKVEAAYQTRTPIEAKVVERVKGGLQVDIGVSAFLPGSQADTRPVHDLEALLGREIQVLVVKVNRRRANVVVSRRELLAAELQALKQETLSKLKEGEPITGRVKNITSYGVFVDLGGIDGLIHMTDISYGRMKDPSAMLQPGSEVTARVLRFDAEKERVSLSIKHMQPDPWEGIEQRYAKGSRVKGAVASISDYGAFVELERDVEGLIHITEMTWSRRLRHPSKTLKVGDEIECVVLKANPEDRRISLSLKRLQPDPWQSLGEEFQVGKTVEGRVRNVTTYGAFVEIREGIDGLAHLSDMTWNNRIKNPKEIVRKGQEIKTVILHVDRKNRRLSLGIKQLEPDAWDTFLSENATGDKVAGLVTRIAKFGAFVEVAPGVEGLCHSSQIPRKTRRGGQALQVGKRYLFAILRINESGRKIGLRCENAAPLEDEPQEPAEAAAETG